MASYPFGIGTHKVAGQPRALGHHNNRLSPDLFGFFKYLIMCGALTRVIAYLHTFQRQAAGGALHLRASFFFMGNVVAAIQLCGAGFMDQDLIHIKQTNFPFRSID